MKREHYWDSLKFILMFLVVCFHTIEYYAPDGSWNRAFYTVFSLFHMPLFIFISGRFSHINDRRKYLIGVGRLLETYLVFQAIKCFIPAIWHGNLSFHTVYVFIVSPRWTLWYLLSLICWRLVIVKIAPPNRLEKCPVVVFSISLMLSIMGGFIPIGNEFSVQRTLAFFPFFIMGYYSVDIDLRKYVLNVPYFLALTSLLSAFLLIFFFLNVDLSFIINCSKSYWSTPNIPPIIRCFGRIIFLMFATFLGFMVMRLVKVHPLTAKWGTKTLGIYIYHSMVVYALVTLINRGYLPQNVPLLFIYAMIIMSGILFLLTRYTIFTIMLNPFSYYWNRIILQR